MSAFGNFIFEVAALVAIFTGLYCFSVLIDLIKGALS